MSDEMRKALEADGEKLRQLTGEDHGPFSGGRTMTYPNYKHPGGYINTDPYYFEEPEPTDEELGWTDIPVNIYGETEEETD